MFWEARQHGRCRRVRNKASACGASGCLAGTRQDDPEGQAREAALTSGVAAIGMDRKGATFSSTTARGPVGMSKPYAEAQRN